MRGRRKKQDKGPASKLTLVPTTNARSADVFEVIKVGVKTEGKTAPWSQAGQKGRYRQAFRRVKRVKGAQIER